LIDGDDYAPVSASSASGKGGGGGNGPLGSTSTPALAEPTYRLDPGASAPAQAPPWSVGQTLATAVGSRCGWTDDLQAVLAGTATTCDVVALSPDSHSAATTLSVPGYDPRRTVGPIGLSWLGTATL